MPETRWVRIAGDGQAYSGPCLLLHIIVYPDANNDYTDIYDGRDATAGKKFGRISTANRTTSSVSFGKGVPFDVGIYIDAKDLAVETTVIFRPV